MSASGVSPPASMKCSDASVASTVGYLIHLQDSFVANPADFIVHTAQASLRDTDWMYRVCNHLCNMSVAASNVLILRTDLLDEVKCAAGENRNNAIKGGIASFGSAYFAAATAAAATSGAATAGVATAAAGAAAAGAGAAGTATAGAATAGAATAGAAAAGAGAAGAATASTAASAVVSTVGTFVPPIIIGSVAVSCAAWAWDNYKKNKELESEYTRFIAGMAFTITSRF
jgi:cobalamin biosynthesis Mg chelatase CobN